MEDSWLCIKDDSSASDSDAIDSETEAELYSTIHYEQNLNSHKTENINFLPFVQKSNPGVFLTPNVNNFCTEEKKQNVKSHSINTFETVSSNHNNYFEINKKTPKHKLLNTNQFNENKNVAFEKCNLNNVQKFQSDNLHLNDSKSKDLNESFRHKSLNHIEKETSDYSSNTNVNLQVKNDLIIIDSSDSDLDLWTEVNSDEKSCFETNLLKDNSIFLSSSDSDIELPTSSSKGKKSNLKNMSMPNIKIGENYKGLWHINDEDLYRKRKYLRRYHANIDAMCSHCNRKGHTFRTCPVPKKIKCFICGGAHIGSRCMNRICSNCSGYGHDSKRCQMRPNNLLCTLCGVTGHIQQNCPDLWRRYHLTTEPINIVKGKRLKQDTNLYCWNCGGHGHYGSVCKVRISRKLTTWPCVVSYDDPGILLKKRLDDSKSRYEQFRSNRNRRDINISLNTTERKHQDKHLVQSNQLNTSDEYIGTRKERKKRQKRNDFGKKKSGVKLQNGLQESDFPRTPKTKKEYKSEMPESVEMIMKKQLKNRLRNRRRNLRRNGRDQKQVQDM